MTKEEIFSEVVRLLSQGKFIKDIASKLEISQNLVSIIKRKFIAEINKKSEENPLFVQITKTLTEKPCKPINTRKSVQKKKDQETGIVPPNNKNPAELCPTCQCLVSMPCLACAVRRIKKNGSIGKMQNNEDNDSSLNLGLELNPEHATKYKDLKLQKTMLKSLQK